MKIKVKNTPCRYPGGKSNALKFLDKYLLKDFEEYRESFFGGGSVGLYLMQFNKNAVYWLNDLFYPVYCFWTTLYNHPEEMVQYIIHEKKHYVVENDRERIDDSGKALPSESAERGRELHRKCRLSIINSIQNKNEFETACEWYILNKLSYSGMSMIGSYAPLAWDQNFTDNCIINLPKTSELMHSVREVVITNLDYTETLKTGSYKTFIFLDPPYEIPHKLYGENGSLHGEFNHEYFSENMKRVEHPWIITYNNLETIKNRFSEFPQLPWDLNYTMKAAKRSEVDKAKVKIEYEGNSPEKTGKLGKELLISSKNYPIDITI